MRIANYGNPTSDQDGGIEMAEVHVHSGLGEVEQHQYGGLKMKRFDVLVSTMISN